MPRSLAEVLEEDYGHGEEPTDDALRKALGSFVVEGDQYGQVEN